MVHCVFAPSLTRVSARFCVCLLWYTSSRHLRRRARESRETRARREADRRGARGMCGRLYSVSQGLPYRTRALSWIAFCHYYILSSNRERFLFTRVCIKCSYLRANAAVTPLDKRQFFILFSFASRRQSRVVVY